jgi:hypothetical protein
VQLPVSITTGPVFNRGCNDTVFRLRSFELLGKPGDIYAIYLKQGGSPKLDLTDAPGNFKVLWYDPRNGGELQEGDVLKVAGGAQQSLGSPPKNKDKDWAVLVRREDVAWPGRAPAPPTGSPRRGNAMLLAIPLKDLGVERSRIVPLAWCPPLSRGMRGG